MWVAEGQREGREKERAEDGAAPANCRQGDGDTGKIELK